MKSASKERRIRRHRKVRAKIAGNATRPRLCVSRSSAHIQAQLVDDEKGVTILGLSDVAFEKKGTKKERAELVGQEIAKRAQKKGITSVVFDRGGYKFHGRIEALAQGARKGGLKF